MKIRISKHAAVNSLEDICERLLKDDLARFQDNLSAALLPQKDYLNDTELALYERGKKLRPILLLLSAHMVHGADEPLPEEVIRAAVSVEMLHVASLIHDDIIDGAETRRGLDTVNSRRGIATAVLIGDMQFLSAIRGFTDSIRADKDMGVVKMALDTSFRICCGELDELSTDMTADFETMKQRYFETIERKTAILFGFACEAGVTLAGGEVADARRAGFFGRCFGKAFQVMDDLFDLTQSQEATGKEKGLDLANCTLSLPLIYALNELPKDSALRHDIVNGRAVTRDGISLAIDELWQTHAFEEAYKDARQFCFDSLRYLSYFMPNRYRSALREIALYIVDRI